MEINQYLIISPGAKSWNPKVRLCKTIKGTMPANAIALKLNIHVPDSIFKKPQLQATIKIKEEDITKPDITAQVLDNIKEVFQQNFGADLTVHIVEQSGSSS